MMIAVCNCIHDMNFNLDLVWLECIRWSDWLRDCKQKFDPRTVKLRLTCDLNNTTHSALGIGLKVENF